MQFISKPFIILSILLGMLFSVHAAKSVYEFSATETYVFSYSTENNQKAGINNFFIKELSKINVNSLSHTRYTFNYSIQKNIHKSSENTFMATAKISGLNCIGDIYYKGFDISDILSPEFSDFTVVVVDQGNYIKKIPFKDIRFDEQKKATVSFDFETWDSNQNLELLISDMHFYSDASDEDVFFNRLAYIDSYYATLDAIGQELKILQSRSRETASIEDKLIALNEAQRIRSTIKTSEYITRLKIKGDKKRELNVLLENFDLKIANFETEYLNITQAQEFLVLSDSYKAMAHKFVDESAAFNLLSQDVTHGHQNYFYYLGTHNRTAANLNYLKQSIQHVLAKTKYCNDTQSVLNRLKHEVYAAYLDKSEQLSSNQEYHQARGVLLQASNFYHLSMGPGIPLDLNIEMSKANYGIYNSYLHLIDRAIDIGNYELAENYIKKANDFQKANPSTIITGKYLDDVLNKLVKLYINKGVTLNQEEVYAEANYCFVQAQLMSNQLGIFNHDYIIKHGLSEARNGLYQEYLDAAGRNIESGRVKLAGENLKKASLLVIQNPAQIKSLPQFDSLTNRLNYQLYLNHIADGKKYLSEGNISESYSSFLNALILESQNTFTIYDPLIDLFSEAAVPYLLNQCKMGEFMVQQERLTEAKEIYDSVAQLQRDFGLNFQQDLQSGLALLNNSMFVQQCEVANNKFDEIIVRFNNAVEAGDFISAMDILDESDDISRKNYYCDIDQSKIVQLQTEYGPAATYQKLASEAQKALSENDYKHFTEIYQQLEDLSARYEMIRKRIEPMPLHYLFTIKKNLAILESSLDQYKNEDDLALALRILQVMETSNISGRDARGLQETLGQKLAYIDHLSADTSNPKDNVVKYTNGNSWYKHFKKAYIKNW